MSKTPSLLLLVAASVLSAGCTTVSTRTTVVNQVAAPNGGASVASASVRVPSAPAGELVPLENWTVTLVTAKAVPRLGEVREISDAFTFEGRIFVHATLTSQPGAHGGQPPLEIRWFTGERLVSVQKTQPVVNKSPFYVTASTSGTSLGIGRARVEIAANGKVLATRGFVVTEK